MPKLFNLNPGGNTPVSGIISAANGLNNNAPHATIVYLGGVLLEDTNIDVSDFAFGIIGTDGDGNQILTAFSPASSELFNQSENGANAHIVAQSNEGTPSGLTQAFISITNSAGETKSVALDFNGGGGNPGIAITDQIDALGLIGNAIYSSLFEPKQYAQNNIVPLLLFQGNLATFTTNQAFSFGGIAGILRVSVMVNYSSGAGSVQLSINYQNSRGVVSNVDLGTVDSVNFSLNAASIPILTDGNGANNINAVVTGTIEYDIAYVIEYFNKQ